MTVEIVVDGSPLKPGDWFASWFPSYERDRSYEKNDLFRMQVVRLNRKTITVREESFGLVRLTPERIVRPYRLSANEAADW